MIAWKFGIVNIPADRAIRPRAFAYAIERSVVAPSLSRNTARKKTRAAAPHGVPENLASNAQGDFREKGAAGIKAKKTELFFPSSCKNCLAATWSRRRDLNSRPLGPEPSALPSCATPRLQRILYQTPAPFASVFPLLFQKDKADRIFAVRPLALFRSSLRLQDTSEWYRTPSEGLLP